MLSLFTQETIDEIMTAYTADLKEALGDNLKAVVLFGSCARGEHEVGSDIDTFVMVENENKAIREAVHEISHKYSWDYDTVMFSFLRSREHYNKSYWETVFQLIRKEGVVYYGKAP